jgi:CTP synthase
LEAVREFGWEWGKENVLYVHLTLVPYIAAGGELKTKPTQHSVKELTGVGIQPDVLLCRTDRLLDKKLKAKIAHFCNVEESAVITAKDVEWIYEVPLIFHQEGLDEKIVEKLHIWTGAPNLRKWQRIVQVLKNPKESVRIAVVGKYMSLKESYKSLMEALVHGGIANDTRVELDCIEAEKIEEAGVKGLLDRADGILVPGGFGDRGSEGKIAAVRYARENRIPFFGICLGMQTAVVEFARNVCGLAGANSSEFDDKSPDPVIHLMEIQKGIDKKGATMRLGAYPCVLQEDSLAAKLYGKKKISERHRHRYEFNNSYRELFSRHGMRLSGLSPDGSLVEIVELKDHPWFLGCQFHPEFKSRPERPEPLFREFVGATLERARARRADEAQEPAAEVQAAESGAEAVDIVDGSAHAS